MKKILALLLALSVLLALTACGGTQEGTPAGESTSSIPTTTPSTPPTTSNPPATDPTGTTPPVTEPPVTEPPTTPPTTPPATQPTTPPVTEPPHSHSYTSRITKEATCAEKGVKTYTCTCGDSYTEDIETIPHTYTSAVIKDATCAAKGVTTYTCTCGDSYTEDIATKPHDIQNPDQIVEGTNTTPGEKKGICVNCNQYATQLTYDEMFMYYAYIADDLGEFSSPAELSPILVCRVFTPVLLNLSYGEYNSGEYAVKITDLNEVTSKYLGTTYDYTELEGYDAETASVRLNTYFFERECKLLNIDTEDHIHFRIEVERTEYCWYVYDDGGSTHYTAVHKYTFNVELIEGEYRITEVSAKTRVHTYDD